MIIKLSILYVLSIYVVLLVHEWLHFILAKFFKYNAYIKRVGLYPFKVVYTNRNNPLDNLLISAISPLFLVIVGIILPLNYYTVILKVSCISNIFNLLPFTADREIILLSIFQIFRRRNK